MSIDIAKLNYALLIICGIIMLIIIVLVFFVILYRKSHNVFIKEKELIAIKFEQTLLQSQLEIQEQTFNRISEEIHDNIGQVLSLVRLNINTFNKNDNEAQINCTDQLLEKAIGDLRNLSHSLNASYIKEVGLETALEELLFEIEKTGQYKTSYINDASFDVPETHSIIVFRMVQEIITNIIRHAEATSIGVRVSSELNCNCITVTDNGKGFDLTNNTKSIGTGIKNIKARASMISAETVFQSVPTMGTSVKILFKKKDA